MKNTKWILIAILFLPFSLMAQNKFFVGGSAKLSISNETYDYRDDTNFVQNTQSVSIRPSFGYMLKEKWVLGLLVNIGSTHQRSSFNVSEITVNGSRLLSTSFGLGTFVRRKHVLNEQVNIFLQGAVDGRLSNTKGAEEEFFDEAAYFKSFAYGASLQPGFEILINKSWMISAILDGLSYHYSKVDDDFEHKSSQMNLGLNARNLKFSLNYLF